MSWWLIGPATSAPTTSVEVDRPMLFIFAIRQVRPSTPSRQPIQVTRKAAATTWLVASPSSASSSSSSPSSPYPRQAQASVSQTRTRSGTSLTANRSARLCLPYSAAPEILFDSPASPSGTQSTKHLPLYLFLIAVDWQVWEVVRQRGGDPDKVRGVRGEPGADPLREQEGVTVPAGNQQ